MKRILCVLIAAIWLCTCWAGNGKKPIVWEQPIAESNQLFYRVSSSLFLKAS